MTYEEIRQNEAVNTYIRQADAALATLGFTEHSFAHVTLVAEKAGYILQTLGYPERTVELAKIAGYLHDIGNLINRVDHSQSGAIMAFRILDHLKFDPEEIAIIVSAIGNHDEGTGVPVSPVAAALSWPIRAMCAETVCIIPIPLPLIFTIASITRSQRQS